MSANTKSFIDQEIDQNKVPFWYAIYTRSRYEKKVAKQLEERGVEYFLPLIPRLRQWKDRKKMVDMPLFSGYVFLSLKSRMCGNCLAHRTASSRRLILTKVIGSKSSAGPLLEYVGDLLSAMAGADS